MGGGCWLAAYAPDGVAGYDDDADDDEDNRCYRRWSRDYPS